LIGDSPGFAGEAAGDAAGDASGLAVETGLGEATGLFGTSAFGSQAPNTAVETARTDTNISLLMIFSLEIRYRDVCRPRTDIHSRSGK
jgi:hypothetical protein